MKRMTALALALTAVWATARAETPAELMNPNEGVVNAGIGVTIGDEKERTLFTQYNGLRRDETNLLLDLLYTERDEATGTWSRIEARNLGLDSREIRGSMERQGNWKVYGEWWELVRWYPRTVNTGLTGEFGTTPVVTRLATPGSGSDLDLRTERKRGTVSAQKWLGNSLMVEAAFTTEDKWGNRLFGRGFTCPSAAAPAPVCPTLASGVNQWAILMLPEPINSTASQLEAKVSYFGEKLSITGGYWGSLYQNHNGALIPTVTGNLNNPLGQPMGTGGGVALTDGLRNILQLPMALPPDNLAHQLSIAGNYLFTPGVRATFRFAYTKAEQKDDFLGNGLTGAPAGRSNYGGEVNTTLAQAGLVAKVLPKLTINAHFRYEDRKDDSPLDLYNVEGTNRFINGTYSLERTTSKLEGTYQLPAGFRALLGVEYETTDRGQFSEPECVDVSNPDRCVGDSIAGITALRAKTNETTYRAELRRSMNEFLTGSLTYSHSDRDGSSWLKPATLPATGTTEVSDEAIYNRTGIFPAMFMNRKRDKVRAIVDWVPMDNLSVQFAVEQGKDKYSAPTTKGLSETGMKLYGIDVSYALSETWKATAYYSYAEQTIDVAHSTGYMMAFENKNTTAGLSLLGNISKGLQLGADFLYIDDRNVYAQTLDASASAANIAFLGQSGGLPDVTFKNFRMKLFGTYAIDKASAIRVEVIHDQSQLHEWQWMNNGVPFLYSDNTTVTLQPDQKVTFIGVTYAYRFR
jgi:MtrB/PioB family decaheme-associated outer membrane protein